SQIPASPIHYYQEIGRAGRDGKEALIILLYNPEDRELPEHFIENSRPPLKHYQRVIGELRNKPLSQWDLMRKMNLPRTKIEVILADLIDQGLLSETVYGRSKRYEYQFNAPPFDNMVVERLREFKLKELEKMVEYAEADRCRMFYLCDYLEDKKADNCHNCDNCRGKKLTCKINAYWQQRVDDFKDNYFPEIELVPDPQPGKSLAERKNKLINGIAFSYYGFSSVGATIHRCKYKNGGNFPDFLLKGVLKAYRSFFKEEKFDLIVYAPPTESGNLVKNFAERIATALKIPISHGLVKLRNTEPQKMLQNSTLKRDNVKGAFSYDNPFEVVGKNVLLIDDICDSKATIREIGSLMTKLGVNKIAPLVIARTIGGDLIEDKPDFPEKREPFAEVRKSYPRPFEKLTKDEEQIYQALRKWRLKKAEESDLPAYCVLSNATLHNIAKTKPSSLWELLEIKGLGKKTIKKFGEEIIEIMSKLAK
ncbi:MAG: HRDC domain-containing protein, partial [candidate division WOR-3 bacterium]|nr:HRDC domain-containing protein [candidate division WOR-3 bacterium]